MIADLRSSTATYVYRSIVALMLVILPVACGRESDKAENRHQSSAVVAEEVRKPDAATFPCPREIHCSEQRKYPGCLYTCITQSCSLDARLGTVGDSPCYGTVDSTGGSIGRAEDRDTLEVACDLDSGAYCDLTSHRCMRVKALGMPCEIEWECGVGKRCLHGKCLEGAQIGSSCAESHCVKQAFCDSKRICQARLANGRECIENNDCKSSHCVKSVCSATPNPNTCAPLP